MSETKFGVFDHIERREGDSLERLYNGRLELLREYDAAGFFGYHVAEHHATPLGMAPSPGIFLSAAAQCTRRIHLGPLVYLLPLYNPLRLISEICMLDQMSGGRLEIGVGRGVSPFELAYYGISFMDSREIFDEALDVVVSGLRSERLSHRGRHYRFDDVPMELRPLQRPNPQFWYGVSSPESLMLAARRGMNMVGGGPISLLKELTGRYREEFALHKGGPHDVNPHLSAPTVGAIRHIYVAADEREVERIAAPAYKTYYDNITKLWLDFRTVPAYGFTPDLEIAGKAEVALAGTVERIRDQVGRFFEESGCNYLVLSFAWGGLSHDDSRRSLERFVTKVMPQFSNPRD
ncbi:MAG TPA: LLM class flavin-dependent oxidoreductase [Candidatus Binataceae bacterium]|nr:LLM class flavin-dependent oxidoreductase [Candidatus Binataceae bacterium]